ncbi:FG-GAP-like repeat-containing protein [Flavobacterium humi]|uniref:T9SS type A sorting domain-containing protein n=1 Tax=Flavobacterium humi TaxID=2562683 RepID=A0A4Z0L6W3_9FLAO|nr:FG-GAP-like repeat-containing protein [Flavobacterium humi]TGD56725.1 T9SS type A sorting domain-containing protein [Flavobacterium humi]
MKKITLLVILCFGAHVSNAQNTCATALPVSVGTFTVGTIDGSPPPTLCAGTGNATMGEWYTYTPSQNYTVTVTTDLVINTGKDTRFHVYTGNCGALTCFTGDDDSGIIGTNSYLSVATFNVTAGTTYYIAFDNRWSASGFDCQLIEQPFVAPLISFTSQSIASSSTICNVADMNGDFLDDIVTVQANQMTVLTQQAAGGFTSTVYPLPGLTTTPSWSIAAGDFDKNGYNDLVFGGGSRLTMVKANATGTGYTEVPYPQGIFTQRTNFIDINNDGHLDLFACHDVAQSYSYKNDGAGNLVFDTTFFPTLAVGGNYASIWSDYDNDGDMDMYLAKCRGGAPVGDPQRINLLYRNNRIGTLPSNTYTEVGASAGVNDGAQSWSTAIEDFDNDGDMDFLLSNISDTNKLYKNNGDGTFTDIYASTGIDPQVGSWELQSGDFNNDGWIDFLWQNSKQMYLNNGNMTFTGVALPFSEGGIGDLNHDGFLDVQYNNMVYYNVPNANHWLTVNLQGVQSNRNGIGTRIEIYGAWGKQIREIRSGNGFSHQSSLSAHFGIGAETAITKVVIKWPSGIVDTINNPTSNQALLVLEGATLGVGEFANSDFKVYPNPVKDLLNIQVKEGNSIQMVQLFDLNGKMVLNTNVKDNTVSVQSLSTGTYLLLLRDANGKDYSQKIIKE